MSADRDKAVRQFKIGDDVFMLDSVGSAFMPWAAYREIKPPVNGQEAESVMLQIAPSGYPDGMNCTPGQGLLIRQVQTTDQSKAQPAQWLCVDIIKAK